MEVLYKSCVDASFFSPLYFNWKLLINLVRMQQVSFLLEASYKSCADATDFSAPLSSHWMLRLIKMCGWDATDFF